MAGDCDKIYAGDSVLKEFREEKIDIDELDLTIVKEEFDIYSEEASGYEFQPGKDDSRKIQLKQEDSNNIDEALDSDHEKINIDEIDLTKVKKEFDSDKGNVPLPETVNPSKPKSPSKKEIIKRMLSDVPVSYSRNPFLQKIINQNPNKTVLLVQKTTRYKCRQCNQRFKSKSSVNKHVQKYHPPVKTLCEICGALVVNFYSHEKTHTKPYKCQMCNISFGRKRELDAHVNTHTRAKTFPCKVCQKVLSSQAILDVHLRKHTEKKRHKCEFCQNCFWTRQNLNRHIRGVHYEAKD